MWKFLVIATVSLFLNFECLADEVQAQRAKFNFNFYIENDTKNLGGPGGDRSYTSGLRFSFLYAQSKVPSWMKVFPSAADFINGRPFNFGLGIGQQLFTPKDLTRRDLITTDRPYAGWLYLSPVLIIKNPNSIETIELDLGVVGPSALGEQTQRNFHKLIRLKEPQGWKNQLRDEPGVLLSYQKRFEIWSTHMQQSWKFFDTVPYYGWGLGNVHTGLNTGAIVRLGYNVPSDYGPARPSSADADAFIKSEEPDESNVKRNFSTYAFGGLKVSGVLHSIFLDGNTFRESHRVTRVPIVADYEAGFFIRYKSFGLTWRQVTRTPEFYQQFKSHTFASVAITYGQSY